jgi:hypothetical protein
MSTAGIYNYNPKVNNPKKTFVQMESGGFQAPFYFGGSQVPIMNPDLIGSGFRTHYEFSQDSAKKVRAKGHGLGLGLQTTVKKNNTIKIPQVFFHK